MTTKGRLAEQILRLYNGGDVSADHSITLEEIMLKVVQVVNSLIKKEYYQTHFPLSEKIPPRSAILTYEDIPVVPYGTVVTGVACTPINATGLYVYWDTGSGFWGEEGEYWAVQLEGVVVQINKIVSNGQNVYVVNFSNITYPNEFDQTDVETFFNDCPSGGVIGFTGMSASVPNLFIKSGIADFTVYDDVISFNYTPANTTSASSAIQSYVSDSHTLLAAIATSQSYTTELGNITCCVDTDNTATLFGKVTLPVQPLNLPNGMGIWKIYNKATPHSPYIPIPTGMSAMSSLVTHNTLSASLANLTCYEWFNNQFAIFNQNTADLPSTVDMQLVVVDPDQLDEYDMLPIPPEMEFDVITEVLKLLGSVQAEDQLIDGNSNK